MVLEEVPLTLAQSIDSVIGMLEHQAQEKGLQLSSELPENIAHTLLQGDPLRLGQVLINLVGNAIKFTDHGSVSLRVQSLAETDDTLRLRFAVADTGIGIESTAQARLFNAFEQADNTMTRKYGGTGLGLAISKRLVELMGGEIGVDIG